MVTLIKGIVFYGKWFQSRGIEVLRVDEANNKLHVKIHSQNEGHHWFEQWNLVHTQMGFRGGDYFIPSVNSPR